MYPAPEDDAPALPMVAGAAGEGISAVVGGEDFAGVRPYQAGDSQKRIAWRLAARSDALAVKLFETTAGTELVLDYTGLPVALTAEQRLSRLARWVLLADAAQLRYALRLPGGDAPADQGPAHRERCLQALALFPG